MVYRKYACIDKYPPGREFVTNSQFQRDASTITAISKLNTSLETQRLKAAFKVASIWKQPELKIAFLDGAQHQREFVQQIIGNSIEPICTKLRFIWNVDPSESDIRVSFALRGQAWSMIGNEAKQTPGTATMNLGWIDDDTDYDIIEYKGTGQVVIHEFGHALGMIHEHQSPFGNPIKWNEPIVYDELKRTNGWTPDQIKLNMFKKYGSYTLCQQAKTDAEKKNYCEGELVNGSEYDPKSIMHYWFKSAWILSDDVNLTRNTTLSELDRKWIGKYYGSVENFTISGASSWIALALSIFAVFIIILVLMRKRIMRWYIQNLLNKWSTLFVNKSS